MFQISIPVTGRNVHIPVYLAKLMMWKVYSYMFLFRGTNDRADYVRDLILCGCYEGKWIIKRQTKIRQRARPI